MFLKIAVYIILSFTISAISSAEVIFRCNFDEIPDWQSGETLTGTSPGSILWSTQRKIALQAPMEWSDYRSARGQLTSIGEKTFQINKKNNNQGSQGKALTVTMEMANNWVGGHLGKWLNLPGYDELYIRWYRKFESGWQYRTKHGGVIHKLLRILSCVDDPHGQISRNPQSMLKTPANRDDWLNNCNPKNSDNMCGKQAYIIVRETNLAGDAGMDGISYSPEGKAGSVSDLSAKFDGRKRIYWKDYHGTWLDGKFPGSLYKGGDWVGNGDWVCYEVHVKMNDIGKKNFLFELFINGKKVSQVSNITLRKSIRSKFNYIMLPDNMLNQIYLDEGDPPSPPEGEQTFAIDDVVISTAYIGPL